MTNVKNSAIILLRNQLKQKGASKMNLSSEEFIERIQKNLRRIRIMLNLSVAEFAGCLGITRQTVNNLETEKTALGHMQVLAVLSVIEHKVRINSPEWYWIQELFGVHLSEFGTNSFLDFWFQINDGQKQEYDTDFRLSLLYENLTKESSSFLTVSRFIDRNDKVYLFYDFLLKKECFIFFDKFTECILERQKCLPLIVLKTHLQALLAHKTPETEFHIVELYEKMNYLKERGFLLTEDSGCIQVDFLEEYRVIYQNAKKKNLFVSVLTENNELVEIAKKNCPVYSIDSFSDIATGGR